MIGISTLASLVLPVVQPRVILLMIAPWFEGKGARREQPARLTRAGDTVVIGRTLLASITSEIHDVYNDMVRTLFIREVNYRASRTRHIIQLQSVDSPYSQEG